MLKLQINKDSIFKVKIEESKVFKDSFFCETYKLAFRILDEIVDNNGKIKFDEYNEGEEINNVLIFTGDRGSGKTSVMTSFTSSLKDNESIKKINFEYRNFIGYKYKVSKLIDPSVFNKNSSIVEIVVAELFREFKDKCNGNDFSSKKELIRAFEDVYKDIRIINKEKGKILDENEESLEVLLSLASATNLKNNMYKLVDLYLKYFRKDFLVIPIDDLDMNVTYGASMIEDIRKYLMLPNIILVMAIKFEQLNDILAKENMKKFKDVYSVFSWEFESNDFRSKADKYLEKIIPSNRRIELPILKVFEDEVIIGIEAYTESSNEGKDSNKISEKIRNLIKEKINFELKMDDRNKYLIPNNLRGVIDLIKILVDMKSFTENGEINNKILLLNINTFMYYIKNRFNSNSSNRKHCTLLDEIIDLPSVYLNKKIIRYIGTYMLKEFAPGNERVSEYIKESISADANINNLSIGYLNQVLELFNRYSFNEIDKQFAFTLKVIYSLKLKILLIYNKIDELKKIIAGDIYGKFYKLLDIDSRYRLNYDIDVYNKDSRILYINGKNDVEKIINSEKFKQLVSVITRRLLSENLSQYKYKEIFYKNTLFNEQFVRGFKENIILKNVYYKFNPLNIINYYIYYDELCENRIGICIEDNDKYTKQRDIILNFIINIDNLTRFINVINDILYKNAEPLKSSRKDYKENFKWYIELAFRYIGSNKEEIDLLISNIDTDFLVNNITILNDRTPENKRKVVEKGYLGLYKDDKITIGEDLYNTIYLTLISINKYLNDKVNNGEGNSISGYIRKTINELKDIIYQDQNLDNSSKESIIKKIDIIDEKKNKLNKTEAKSEDRKTAISNINMELKEILNSINKKGED